MITVLGVSPMTLPAPNIRFVSRALAIGAALCCAWLLSLRMPVRLDDGATQAGVIVQVEFSAPPPRPVRPPPPKPRLARTDAAPARPTTRAAPFVAPVLWTYDAQGRVVFPSRDQLERCLDARANHLDRADCPSKNDRREYRGPVF